MGGAGGRGDGGVGIITSGTVGADGIRFSFARLVLDIRPSGFGIG